MAQVRVFLRMAFNLWTSRGTVMSPFQMHFII